MDGILLTARKGRSTRIVRIAVKFKLPKYSCNKYSAQLKIIFTNDNLNLKFHSEINKTKRKRESLTKEFFQQFKNFDLA